MSNQLGACLGFASRLLKPAAFNAERGRFEISKIFIFSIFSHLSLMSVAVSYCFMKWPEVDMNNVTELTAVFLILSRECGYSLLLYRNWSKIEELLQKVVEDRKALEDNDDTRTMSLRYSKVEVSAMVFYFIALVASILLSTAAAALICPNDFCLPINCYIFFLSPDHGYNWLVNYLYQGTVYTFEAVFFTGYLSTSLVMMDQSCCLVDSILISLQKFEEKFVEGFGDRPNAEINDRFIEIIKSTWKIMKWQRSVQNLMEYSFLFEISLLSTVFCMTIFTLSTNVAGSSVALLITLSNFSQFFLYCWMGSEYFGRIEKLSNTLFGLNWNDMTPNQRKNLELVIMMTQRMKGFSGIFMRVDFGALTKIMNLSYSFLAMLRSTSS